MSGLLSKIGDLLYWEARRDPELWKESSNEPNGLALAERMKVSQPTVWRLLKGKRSLRRDRDSDRPLSAYMPTGNVLEAIGRLINKSEPSRILYAIQEAPPRPPPSRNRRKATNKRATARKH